MPRSPSAFRSPRSGALPWQRGLGAVAAAILFVGSAMTQVVAQAPLETQAPRVSQSDNPYGLEPFYPDFPVTLDYPDHTNIEYDRTRRQVVERIVKNLEGAGRREAWKFATEFFWNATDEFIEPLIEEMDRALLDPSRTDMVRNCAEAMGRMGRPEFDAALRRALEHTNDKVRQAALGALARSSTKDTLRGMARLYPSMNARGRQAWLLAVRERLEPAEVVEIYTPLMMANVAPSIRDEVLRETMKLPPEFAAPILRGRWDEALGEFKAIIAGILHAAGDTAGTTWLRDALGGTDLQTLTQAIRHSRFGELGLLRNDLLALSTHPRADIRLELARLLRHYDGDDIADVYEVLSQPEEAWEVKSLSLRELRRRGRTAVASALLDEVKTAKGTRLQRVLDMLGATADPRAVPIFKQRFEAAPEGEGRPFLQSLAVLGGEASARAMLDIFKAEEKVVDRKGNAGQLTTINYIPLLLMNVRGTEQLIVETFQQLDTSDWRRRAALMPTILGMAADNTDPIVSQQAAEPIRAVLFDRSQIPQLRVLALNLLARRHLTVDDVMKLKNRRFDEQPGLRTLLSDFLVLFF